MPSMTPPSPKRPENDSPWAINLVRIAGIPIRIHLTFILFLGVLALVVFKENRLQGILIVLAWSASVLLHELGHSLVAKAFGVGVSEIVLSPIGGIARLEKQPKPFQELWITLAGPAVNVIIAILISVGMLLSGMKLIPSQEIGFKWDTFWTNILFFNLFLAVFNMIPAFPMDGGRVLRALLALWIGEQRATAIAVIIGQFLAIGIGVLSIFTGNYMFLVIAFFVYIGASQEIAITRNQAVVEGVLTKAVMMTDFRTLPVGSTLQEAVNLLLATSQQDFPIIFGEEVVGVLSRQALLRGLSVEGPNGYVNGTMNREFLRATPDSDLQETAVNLQTQQQPCVLVMEEDHLLGIVTPENIAEFLVVRQIMNQRQG